MTKFTVSAPRRALAKALRLIAAAAAPRRSTVPILSTVKIQAFGGEALISATDLDFEACAVIGGSEARGAACVDARRLRAIAEFGGGERVEISSRAAGAELFAEAVCGETRGRLALMGAGDFPTSFNKAQIQGVSIEAAHLRRLLTLTRPAISKEETRYYLNGVYLHRKEGGPLLAVATDGHRLALAETPAPMGLLERIGGIVPRRAVDWLIAALDGLDEPVMLALDIERERLTVGAVDWRMSAKLISGQFPDYSKVVPQPGETPLRVDAKALRQAIRRTTALAGARGGASAVVLALRPDALLIEAQGEDHMDAAVETIPAHYAGAPKTLGLDPHFLKPILRSLSGDALLHVTGAQDAVRIEDAGDPGVTHVVMPVVATARLIDAPPKNKAAA